MTTTGSDYEITGPAPASRRPGVIDPTMRAAAARIALKYPPDRDDGMAQPTGLAVALGVAALAELLLVLAAVQKLAHPAPAAGALQQVGLNVPLLLIRIVATAEAAAGLGALATGKAAFTALVALCYLAFAAFIAVALRRPVPVTSCGCFGSPRTRRETPPTRGHLAFDLGAALVCVTATIRPLPGVLVAYRHQPLGGVPLLGLVALGCWLSWVLLTVAPQTAAATAARPSKTRA